jgi:hypothetical protein
MANLKKSELVGLLEIVRQIYKWWKSRKAERKNKRQPD